MKKDIYICITNNQEMKAQELRIGNWVHAFKTSYKIDATDFQGEKISTYKPIPLTEEWLLKFGFKKDYDNAKDHRIGWYENGPCRLEVYSAKVHYVHSKKHQIKYVHQLQNLYFALTGEELTISDNG